MSFLGSIAGPLRKVLAAYADEISVPVLLPCAGNFTVGAALRSGGYRGRITGCDITLYTSALGAYLAGDHLQGGRARGLPGAPARLAGLLGLRAPRGFGVHHAGSAPSLAVQKCLASTGTR